VVAECLLGCFLAFLPQLQTILTLSFYLLKILEEVKISKEMDRDTLINVARTSLRTKLHTELADLLTEVN